MILIWDCQNQDLGIIWEYQDGGPRCSFSTYRRFWVEVEAVRPELVRKEG